MSQQFLHVISRVGLRLPDPLTDILRKEAVEAERDAYLAERRTSDGRAAPIR